jgi:hypothetical protein
MPLAQKTQAMPQPTCVLMQAVLLCYGVAWLRRRKLAELNEVKQILDEMDGKSVR